ncbi:YgjP-like metallopeptidase domain-containing protein, partial [Turicibacter sanguinis]
MKLQFETFEVLLERKNIKNMYLKIRPSGEIVVTANSKMELSFIKDFILSKETWIHQKL